MELKDLTTRADFGTLCKSMGFKKGMEIGVGYGENAERILEQFNGFLFLVDPWDEQDEKKWPDTKVIGNKQECFVYCSGKLSRFKKRTVFIRLFSDEALSKFEDESLDFVYVDGNHASPQVDRDVENWWRKVRPGGIFGGHDYYDNHEPSEKISIGCDVKTVVDKFVALHDLELHLSDINSPTEPPSWWIQKP